MRWLWAPGDAGDGRIPLGELTLIVGRGGIGKSTLPAEFIAVTAHDAGLALSRVEESAGFGGKFDPVPGPVGAGKASFEVGVDQLVGVELG